MQLYYWFEWLRDYIRYRKHPLKSTSSLVLELAPEGALSDLTRPQNSGRTNYFVTCRILGPTLLKGQEVFLDVMQEDLSDQTHCALKKHGIASSVNLPFDNSLAHAQLILNSLEFTHFEELLGQILLPNAFTMALVLEANEDFMSVKNYSVREVHLPSTVDVVRKIDFFAEVPEGAALN